MSDKTKKEESRFMKFWGDLDFWVGPIKPIFDFVVIIVMVLSLLSAYKSIEIAHDANNLTKQSLQSNYVPWPKVIGFSIQEGINNTVDFNFRIKNYSPVAPAINLTIKSIIPKILNEQMSYKKDALMPGEEGEQLLTLNINSTEEKATIQAIQTGKLPVRISISCTDIFGTQYTIEQEIRKIGNVFRMIEYSPKVIASSLYRTK
jgi:hypothetical protein